MKHNIERVANFLLRRINRRLVRVDDNKLIEVEYPYILKTRSWSETAGIQRIKEQMISGEGAYAEMLLSFSRFTDKFQAIPVEDNGDDKQPYWINGYFPGLDAVTIYSLLAIRNPSVYFEIGSGSSTKFARRSIEDNGLVTKIISLDPEPRAEIDGICDEIIRNSCEEAPISLFENLPGDTIFFLDGSHRAFQNSDVTVFFTEILPSLPVGCVWSLHDIELPFDYPADMTDRYYNEQYLLLTYLLGGGGNDTILLPAAFIRARPRLSKIVTDVIFGHSYFDDIEKFGCCFWMLRGEKIND